MGVDRKREEVLAQLSTVQDPDLHRDLVSLGMIQDVSIQDSGVSFSIVLTTPACPVKNDMKEWARAAVARLPWVREVNVDLRSQTVAGRTVGQGQLIPKVKNVIAVASGKGGVGKSTVAVNLAVGLAAAGARVGLLDTDVYGPSVPILTGLQLTPEEYSKQYPPIQGEMIHPGDANHEPQHRYLLRPIEKFGLKIMSIGFLVDPAKAVVWRGPMVHGAIQQFLRDVQWGDLD